MTDRPGIKSEPFSVKLTKKDLEEFLLLIDPDHLRRKKWWWPLYRYRRRFSIWWANLEIFTTAFQMVVVSDPVHVRGTFVNIPDYPHLNMPCWTYEVAPLRKRYFLFGRRYFQHKITAEKFMIHLGYNYYKKNDELVIGGMDGRGK